MQKGLLDKNRLEFFSDAVFAIIITIMVIEFHAPEGTAFADLMPLFPTFLAYILSFIYLSIYWNNHHHMLKAAKGVNGAIQWANMGLLFWLTLIPFATSWMGENYGAIAPTVIYGVVLLGAAIAYFILQGRIIATLPQNSAYRNEIGRDYKGTLSEILYIAGIALTFVTPVFGQLLYALVALMWIVPDRRVVRALSKQ